MITTFLGENEDSQNNKSGYFASLKSMVTIKGGGGGGVSKLKATAVASTWMSPTSKKSLNEGISRLNSAISNATSTLSKRVEELREQQGGPPMPGTPSKASLTTASSNPNLSVTKVQKFQKIAFQILRSMPVKKYSNTVLAPLLAALD